MRPIPRWFFLCLPALLGSSFAFRPALAQENLADVIERAEKSVVRIEVSGADGDSLGSGYVVDHEGTIVTNCHVLAGAHTATVHFPNGRSCPILGTLIIDETRDIVVAKIAITDAPPIQIASLLPRKGESVTALGSPHGLSFTATTGIVSAIRPAAEMAEDMGRSTIQGTWIQVDAALSPGNSGGPLINSAGEVVAMSTLASLGGRAQNLNFGISANDIATAVKYSKNHNLASLPAGVAKIRMRESGSDPGAGPGAGGGLAQKPIPPSAFENYIATGKEDFPDLVRGLRMESARLSADLKEMRKGETYLPPAARRDGAAIVRVSLPGRREGKWYFLSQTVKQTALTRQQARIRSYTKLKNSIRNNTDADSMFSLLWNYGPALDARKTQSIGFATDLIVVHAFNDHDVLVAYNESPYLLWMESTAGVSGGDILSRPVFVAGTSTAVLRSGMTTSLTVLQDVPELDLRKAVSRHFGGSDASAAGATGEASGGYRTWNDRTGRFTVEALLLSSDGTTAVLKKRDGSVIRVPISALCDADVKYIND